MSPLDLSLPEAPRKGPSTALVVFTLLVSLLSLAGVAACLWLLVEGRGPAAGPSASLDSPERLAALARDLEKRTLWDQAAEVWREHIRLTRPVGEEAARSIHRLGINLQRAGRAAEAARCFTEVTQPAGEGLPLDAKERRDAHRRLLECLSALGKEEAREEALRAFAIPDARETGTVVARVGDESITLEELREERVAQLLPRLAAETGDTETTRLEATANERARDELRDETRLREAIADAVTARVLYREGLSRGHGSGAEHDAAIARLRRGWIAGKVIEDLTRAAAESVSETDVRNHWSAHRDRFVAPASVRFSYASFPDEAAALAAIAALGDATGESAPIGAPPALKPSPTPALSDGTIGALGRSAEAWAALQALDDGGVARRPLAVNGSWLVLRADEKRPRRPLALEECVDAVRRDLLRRRLEESSQDLRQALGEKFEVALDEAAIRSATRGVGDARAADDESGGSTPSAAGGANDPATTIDPGGRADDGR